MSNAIGYTRLSQESDTSIDRQKRKIREYCRGRGFELEEIIDDGQHTSGFETDRAGYQDVKARIRDGSVDVVVVHDKTRIGRDFDERMRFVLDLREYDAELHSARRGPVDLSNPTDAAVESIHAAKDDEGKREEIEKSKEAVKERLEAGYDHGRPRFGMTYDEKGRYQIPGDDFEVVEEIFELRDEGATLTEIEDEVGVSVATASRVLKRRDWYEERSKRIAE